MAQWENADGWEDAGWEDVPVEAPFGKQVKSAAKKSFAGLGNMVDRAWSGLALGLADKFQDPQAGEEIYRNLQDRINSRNAFASEDEVKAGIPASVLGSLPTLPSQILAFPFSPFETGQRSLEMGEDLGTAQGNQAISGVGNAAAIALPASLGLNKIVQAGSGAAMNMLQTYLTGKAIAANSSTPEAKKEFEPTWEQLAQAGILGAGLGVAAGKRAPAKPKTEGKSDVAAKLAAMDEANKPVEQPAVKPPIDNVNQMELPDSAMIQAPQYGVHEGMGRVDENGMPIRADISMEAQNMQNPLQMNLWGDELGPALGQERGLTDAIDQMRESGRMPNGRFMGKDFLPNELGREVPATDELEAAKYTANRDGLAMDVPSNPTSGTGSPLIGPKSQRGAINMDMFDPAYEKIKQLANGIRLKITGSETGPTVTATKNGKLVGYMYGESVNYADPKATDNLESAGTQVIPEFQKQGVATEMYKFLAENGNDIVPSKAQMPAGKAMWKGFEKSGLAENRMIKRGQRGGIDFKAISEGISDTLDKISEKMKPPKTKEDALAKLPGMQKAGKDLIYVPEAGALLAEQARGEADGPKLFGDFQAGLDHASEKSGSTLMKGAAQWLQYARRMAEYGIRTEVIPLEKAFSDLSTKEMVDLMEVNRMEMFNRKQYSADQLTAAGMNEKQIAAYNKFRAVQAKVLETQNAGRAAMGLDPITPQNAYLSSVFSGDYHIAVKNDKGQLVWYIQQKSMKDAKAAMAWLKENGQGLDLSDLKVEYKPRPFATVPRDVMGAYQDALKMFPEGDPVADRVRSIMEEYATAKGNTFLGQNLHHVDKKANVRGFMGDQPWLDEKTNAYNQAKAQIDYMKDAFRWTHMQEALTQLKPMISDPELIKSQPNNMGVTKSYVLNNMGVSKNLLKGVENELAKITGRSSSLVPGIVRDLKGLAYMMQLGGSVGYMIATPFQLIPGLAGWHSDLGFNMKNFYKDLPLTLSDGIIGMFHDIAKDITSSRWDSTSNMTDFGKEAYRWGEANGVFSANLFDENAGLGAHKMIAEGKNLLGYTISKPDQMSRWFAFLSFARHLEGMPEYKGNREGAFQRAAELTEHVATDMHRQSRPLIVDKWGFAGEAAYMYRAPQVNMLNTLSIFARKAAKGNVMPLFAYLSGMAMMGGVLNLPGVSEIDQGWELLKDGIAKHKPEWYKHVENVGIKQFVLSHLDDSKVMDQIAGYGATSVMFGANMSSRFNQQVIDVKDPLSGFSPLAQEIKEWGAIGKFGLNPNEDTFAQGVHDAFMPPIGQGLMQRFAPQFKSGVQAEDGSWTGYKNPRDIENPATMVKRSPREEDYKMLGLTALSEAQRRTKDYVSNQESARVGKAQEVSLEKMWSAIRRDDPKDVEKYAKAYFELKGDPDKFTSTLLTNIEHLGMTPTEFQKAHINGLRSLNNVIRRMNMDQGNQ